jgi:hypothetical protein
MFPVRYKLNFYILFRWNSVLEGLNSSTWRLTLGTPESYEIVVIQYVFKVCAVISRSTFVSVDTRNQVWHGTSRRQSLTVSCHK